MASKKIIKQLKDLRFQLERTRRELELASKEQKLLKFTLKVHLEELELVKNKQSEVLKNTLPFFDSLLQGQPEADPIIKELISHISSFKTLGLSQIFKLEQTIKTASSLREKNKLKISSLIKELKELKSDIGYMKSYLNNSK